jgi:hypothetical protein
VTVERYALSSLSEYDYDWENRIVTVMIVHVRCGDGWNGVATGSRDASLVEDHTRWYLATQTSAKTA